MTRSELGTSLQDEAAAHLRALRPGSDRPLTVWSAGAITVNHALPLHTYLRTNDPQSFAPIYQGGVLEGYRYEADPKGVTVTSSHTGHSETVRWREIADLVAPALRRPGVREAIQTALHERVEQTRRQDEAFRRWQRGHQPAETDASRTERNQAWSAIERHCYQLAAETWKACRPSEQTTLFDL